MKIKKISEQLIRFSMIAYVLWLMLPAVQTTGRAMTGAACVGLFGLGVMLDVETLKKQWLSLLLRAGCAAVMPLFLRRFMDRGGEAAAGFYVQNAMLWFPLVFAGHVRTLKNKELWKSTQWVLPGVIIITLLTTTGWLIEGLSHSGNTGIYSRMLGSAEAMYAAQLKTLMLRNIGGYDFIYAMVVSLPLVCIAISHSKGGRRWAFIGLIILQLAAIFLSQYTYALLYTGLILGVEIIALIIRKLSRNRVKTGVSLACGLIPFTLLALFAKPLLSFAIDLLKNLGFYSFATSLDFLYQFLQSGSAPAVSRLPYYLTALEGFRQSPLIGTLAGGEQLLSYHSDVLDLLSGAGVAGVLIVGLMLWLMGRGSLRGLRQNPDRAHLIVMYAAVFLIAALNTVVYSREILVVALLGTLFVLEAQPLHGASA